MSTTPVGIFDSGTGGLSVLKAFRAIAPNENVIYLADTDYFPYGPRPAPEVRKRSFALVRRLLRSDVKLIVVACNTASAAALAELREAFSFIPFVGMVPGLKPAIASSPGRNVAILATPGTVQGALYGDVYREFGRGTKVHHIEAEGLAELVESGRQGTAEARVTIRSALEDAVSGGADTVVLGCTHYAFLTSDIEAEYPGLRIIDTSEAVARRAVTVLEEESLRSSATGRGSLSVVVTGNKGTFFERMASLGFEHTPE